MVQRDLEAQGKGLLVYDAYRPLRGTLGMVAWAKRTDQVHLLDNGYIARRSGHNKGNTIDLSVVDLATGQELDMGTPWDTLDERSHTRNAAGTALENRMLLRGVMHAHGWRNYSKEWWHYSFAMEGDLRHRDVPYACFEPGEGSWSPPAGWSNPGFSMPMEWAPHRLCRVPELIRCGRSPYRIRTVGSEAPTSLISASLRRCAPAGPRASVFVACAPAD